MLDIAVLRNGVPFDMRWEASAPTPTQTRDFYFLNDRIRLHRQRFFEVLVTAMLTPDIDGVDAGDMAVLVQKLWLLAHRV